MYLKNQTQTTQSFCQTEKSRFSHCYFSIDVLFEVIEYRVKNCMRTFTNRFVVIGGNAILISLFFYFILLHLFKTIYIVFQFQVSLLLYFHYFLNFLPIKKLKKDFQRDHKSIKKIY